MWAGVDQYKSKDLHSELDLTLGEEFHGDSNDR